MPALQRGKTHLSETLWTAVHGEAAGVSDAPSRPEGEGARQRDLDKVQTELRAWYVGEVRRIFEAAAKREARATLTALGGRRRSSLGGRGQRRRRRRWIADCVRHRQRRLPWWLRRRVTSDGG